MVNSVSIDNDLNDLLLNSDMPLGIGTWQAGKNQWVGIDDASIDQALDLAFRHGVRLFDTAPDYGNGYSECVLGRAIVRWDSDVCVVSKLSPFRLAYSDVGASSEASLRRLKRDYLDALLIHWPSGAFGSDVVPISDTMRALTELKKAGKIRWVGVSNFSLPQLMEARQYGPIDLIQVPYSLFWPHIQHDLLPFCQSHGITILAYSPLAQGLLTGKFLPDHVFDRGDHRRRNILFKAHLQKHVACAINELKVLAISHQFTLPQLALRWVSSQGIIPVVGVREPAQVSDNLGGLALPFPISLKQKMDRIASHVVEHLDQNRVMWR